MSEVNEAHSSGEWTKFGILIAVMFLGVLFVALSRPIIFGHVVPVVLGESLAAPLLDEDAKPHFAEDPDEVEPAEFVTEPTQPEAVSVPENEAEGSASSVEETEAVELVPTNPPAITHIVKAGETLTSIAEQYNVTVDGIAASNQLTNANRINAGDELKIPASGK